MVRAPCCEKNSVKRGPWTPEEDAKLLACISQHGTGSWRALPKKAGLQRCGKSCRLRWTNYLRPDLKHGRFSEQEEELIVNLHAAMGSRWSLIAAQLPGRTDNDVKNYWNTRLKKKLCEMGIDPITHKPISQLLADLASSINLPKGKNIAEATLGCFKNDMLHVLMRNSAPHTQADSIFEPPKTGPYGFPPPSGCFTQGPIICPKRMDELNLLPYQHQQEHLCMALFQQPENNNLQTMGSGFINDQSMPEFVKHREVNLWSPSCSGSSSSNTSHILEHPKATTEASLMAEGPLSSDVMWDLSELGL